MVWPEQKIMGLLILRKGNQDGLYLHCAAIGLSNQLGIKRCIIMAPRQHKAW